MISSLAYFLQDRKRKLTTYLNSHTDELTLEKQHQFYGAIAEIDLMTNMLSEHRKKEIDKELNPEEIFLFRPIQGKGIIRTITNTIKDLL